MDSSVSSSGNGQSWGTAWKQFSNISGVQAGDTVYISGGSSGNSQTYTFSGAWTPLMGTSGGGSITYQIGQDSSHNGIAILNGPGNSSFFQFVGIQYVTLSGNANNDGARHLVLTNWQDVIARNHPVLPK